MRNEYPRFKRGEIEGVVWAKLPQKEKTMIEEYLIYRKARGVGTESKLQDIRRVIMQLRYILDKPFDDIDIKDLRRLLGIIQDSNLTNYVKNAVKTDLKNFLKYKFNDWSMRFSNLDDIKLGSNGRNEEKINAETIFKKEDIDKLIKHENSLFWKSFLLVQYEAGLRTKEVRELKWSSIKLSSDGDISEVNIFATKTQRARTIFIKEATFFLKRLLEEQENLKEKGVYIFHSKNDLNAPINKATVSMWFRRLTKKVLGREGWSYLLRHTRGTELYKLADENKIAKETAIKFMGHSKDMSYTYTHLDKKAVEEMLKNQVYKIEEIAPEKKHELELQIEELRKQIEGFRSLSSEVKAIKQMLNPEDLEDVKLFIRGKKKK